jgi:proline iminopeptidase
MSMNETNMHEGRVAVTGGNIWYGIAGHGSSGIPLLVLHGGPGAPHDYLEPLAELADERPVIFYDQLGCGNSDKPEDASLWVIERFVDEIGLLRDALKLRKVHLLGQSWGSSLAIEYILTKQPAGVMSSVLSGPLVSASRWIEDQKAYLSDLPDDLQDVIRKAELLGNFQSAQYQDAVMRYYKRHVCRLETWPECLNRTLEKLAYPVYLQMWGPSEFTVTGTLKNYERVDALKRITVPALFTCGEYDEATPATTRHYQRQLPGSKIVVLEGASHLHHLEKPQEYLRIVREFLMRAESS